jgi:integrase/recombinase XerC
MAASHSSGPRALAYVEVPPSGLALPGTITFRLVDAFLADKEETSRRGYFGDLGMFAEFTGHADAEAAAQSFILLANGPANAVLLAWKADMLDRGLSAATVNRRLACVRSLVKRARQLGMTTLCVDVEGLRRQPYRDTRGPGVANAARMLSTVAARPGARGARDVALLALAIDCGLRRSEILGLDVAHVDLAEGLVWILGKARRDRESITLPEPTRAALARWIEHRGDHPGPLFPAIDRAGRFGGRMTGQALYAMIARVARKLGFRCSPHRLRHTAITAGLDLTKGDVRSVRLFSRHRDVATVMHYDDRREDRGGSIAKLVAAAVRHAAGVAS